MQLWVGDHHRFDLIDVLGIDRPLQPPNLCLRRRRLSSNARFRLEPTSNPTEALEHGLELRVTSHQPVGSFGVLCIHGSLKRISRGALVDMGLEVSARSEPITAGDLESFNIGRNGLRNQHCYFPWPASTPLLKRHSPPVLMTRIADV